MTETTERFLQEIASRVGYDRVAELYLFPVLRQGGVEGAVAVVAAHPEAVVEPVAEPVAEPSDADADTIARLHDDAPAGDTTVADAEPESTEASETNAAAESGNVSDETEATVANASDEATDVTVATESSAPVSRPERARHVVYTARYRHTIKGTDRGRWMVEVVAEADAPLITVEEVVRGVVRRSGDAFQPERISGDQFRAIVPAPAIRESAPA